MTAYPGGLCRECSMAQPLNRCAVAFSVSCEQWKSPALLHAKRELLPRGLWLQGHVMVFTSYQSTHPAQVGCFSTLSGHIGFLQKHLVRQQLSGLSVVEDWDPSPQNRKDATSASPSSSAGQALVLCSGQVAHYLGYTESVTQRHHTTFSLG